MKKIYLILENGKVFEKSTLIVVFSTAYIASSYPNSSTRGELIIIRAYSLDERDNRGRKQRLHIEICAE